MTIPVTDIIPSATANDEIITYYNGSANVTRWLNQTGGTSVNLYNYLQRTSDIQDAIALCLSENSTATTINFPSGTFEITKQLTTGLRSNLWMRGTGNTLLRVDMTSWSSGMSIWGWPTSSSNIRMSDLHFQTYNQPASTFGALVHAYSAIDVLVENCTFEGGTFTTFGTKLALALIGATRAKVMHCTFIRSQCAFAGVGSGCSDCEFSDNQGREVNDFLCSAVTDSAGGAIRNIKITDNVVKDVSGSGCFFVGSDGLSANAAVVSDIDVSNNTISGACGLSYQNAPSYILINSGVATSRIKIHGNQLSRSDANAAISAYGIRLLTTSSGASEEDVSIVGNVIGPLGPTAGAITGIEVQLNHVNGLLVSDNMLNATRGMLIRDCREAIIHDNVVRQATSHALYLVAASRSISDTRIHHNHLVAVVGGTGGIVVDGSNNTTITCDNNYFSGDAWAALKLGVGVLAVRSTDNQYGVRPADNSYLNSRTYVRDDF